MPKMQILPEHGGDAYYSLWGKNYLENASVILVSQVWNIVVGDVDLFVYTSLARSRLDPYRSQDDPPFFTGKVLLPPPINHRHFATLVQKFSSFVKEIGDLLTTITSLDRHTLRGGIIACRTPCLPAGGLLQRLI